MKGDLSYRRALWWSPVLWDIHIPVSIYPLPVRHNAFVVSVVRIDSALESTNPHTLLPINTTEQAPWDLGAGVFLGRETLI